MKLVQSGGDYEPQFLEIANKALDKTQFEDVTTPATPGDEFAIEHGMGVLPIGYLVIKAASAGVGVYDGATAWTTEKIYLRSTAGAVAVRIMVF